MRIGSLCSGYGGIELAAIELFPDAEVAWHCEYYDEAPSKILAHHWPDVPNHHDITAIDWTQVEPIDVLTAGYPCQPFSAAGRRKGTSDERHLWPYVRNAIRVLRPRFALLENVAGHRALGFDRVLGDCAEDGLHVRWTSIRASDIGACHHRERLFILVTQTSDTAHDGRNELDDSARSEATRSGRKRITGGSDRRAPVPLILPTPRASDGAKGGPNQRGSSGDLMLPSAVMAMLPTPKTTDENHSSPADMNRNDPGLRAIGQMLPTPMTVNSKSARTMRSSNGDQRTGGGQSGPPGLEEVVSIASGVWPEHMPPLDQLPAKTQRLLPTPDASCGTGGGSHPDQRKGHTAQIIDYALLHGSPQWGTYEAAIRRQEALSRPAPSPTEPNRKGNPRLSARFAEWMMWLPDGWVTDPAIGLSRTEQLKAIGNGVVPPQAIAAFRYLLSLQEKSA